jgi:uncharacterized membrane protein (UPF0127 family)
MRARDHIANVALLVAVLLAGCGPEAVDAPDRLPELNPEVDALPAGQVIVRDVGGEEVAEVAVRVARTPEERSRGLMNVSELPTGVGMLFVNEEDVRSGFWMKDTLVRLDILWADADGTVVDTAEMEPCAADPCPSYAPGEPYRYALEVPAGWIEGIEPGWQLELPADLDE